jgi:hypothetical protein
MLLLQAENFSGGSGLIEKAFLYLPGPEAPGAVPPRSR